MIPILYSTNQTDFDSNGVGLLSDAVLCECTEKLNGIYELKLEIPRTGSYANDIRVDYIIKVRPNYEDPPQLFRIYSVEKEYKENITVRAAHISYDSVGIPILPFTSENLSDALDNIESDRLMLSGSPFVLNAEFEATGKLEIKKPSSFRSLLFGSDSTIVGVYGGEFHYDNYVINLVEKRGTDKGVCFRYGKNISDFEQKMDSEDLYTSVVGYWRKSGTNNQPDTIIYGDVIECEGVFPYDKIYILDTTSEIKTENDAVATVDQINEVVEQYITKKKVGLLQLTMKIDYTDDDIMAKICLGDTLGVIYPDYNINIIARCNTVVFDCLLEKNKSIEIGVEDKVLADTLASIM